MKKFLKELRYNKQKRTKVITYISMIYNFLWSICKIGLGVLFSTFFYCLSGTISLLFGIIKKTFLSTYYQDNEKVKVQKSKTISFLIVIVGILYCAYMIKLFYRPEKYEYTLVCSIVIALFSFTELGLSLFNLYQARKAKDIILSSFRNFSVVSSMFAIVLTQMALLSAKGNFTSPFNAVAGMIAGFMSILIGVLSFVKIKKNYDC